MHHLGQTYGSTREERGRWLPGDDVVAMPQFVVTHAATLDAPPEDVWRWLKQVGWHRGGWYTPRWVDTLFFPRNDPSTDRIIPELQHLQVGDFIPDGPPETECGFVVEGLVPSRQLILHSSSHLPLAWRRRGLAAVDWSWAFLLLPLDGGTRTRFLFRWRARAEPWWLVVGCWLAVIPADLVMSKGMLDGLRARVGRRGDSREAVDVGLALAVRVGTGTTF